MAESEMINISTKLDDSGFKQLEETASQSFSSIVKEAKALEKELDELNKERKLFVRADTDDARKKLTEVDKKISDLQKQKEIKLALNAAALNKAKTELANFAKGFVAVSAAAAVAAGALVAFSLKTAQSLDRVDKASQKLGLTKKTFQELDYIAGQLGTSVEATGMSMRQLVMAATGGGTAFKKLGVEVKDTNGKLKNQEQLFFEVISKLQGVSNQTERSKLSFELLGRSALELAPILNAGAGEMENLRKRAYDLGLVMSDQTVMGGVLLGDLWDDLRKAGTALMHNVFIPLMPLVTDLLNYLIKIVVDLRPLVVELMPKLVSALKWIKDNGAYIIGFFGSYAAAVVIAKLATIGLSGAIPVLIGSLKSLGAAISFTPVIGQIALALSALTAAFIYTSKNGDVMVANVVIWAKSMKVTWLTFKNEILIIFRDLVTSLTEKAESFFSFFGINIENLTEDLKDFANEQKAASREALNAANKELDEAIKLRNVIRDAKKAEKDNSGLEKAAEDLKNFSDGLKKSYDVQGENKRDFKKELADLDNYFKTQKDVINQTVEDEKEKLKKLDEAEQEFSKKKLDILLARAETEMSLNKTINKNTIEAIKQAQGVLKEGEKRDYSKELEDVKTFYDAQKEIINSTAKNKKEKDDQMLAALEEYAKKSKDILTEKAVEEIKLAREVSAETIAAFKKIEEETKKGPSFFDSIKSAAGELKDHLKEVFNSIFDYMNASIEREIEQLDRQFKYQDKLLEDSLDEQSKIKEKHTSELEDLEENKGTILTEADQAIYEQQRIDLEAKIANDVALEQDLAAQKEALAKETAIKSAQLERKLAENKKKQAIANAWVSIAEGIMRGYAEYGAIIGSVMAALVLSAGLLQIASINKQPLPEIPSFWDGGEVGPSNAHQVKGIKPSPNPQDTTLLWASPGERILTREENSLYNHLFASKGLDLMSAERFGYFNQVGSSTVDNSQRNVTQNINIQTKKELSFTDGKRLGRKMAAGAMWELAKC